MSLVAWAAALSMCAVIACRGEPSDRELAERGFRWSPSEEAVAWPSQNQLVVLWKDEWRSGPDAVWIRCHRTGVYEIDSTGSRSAIRAGQDVCDATAQARDFDLNNARGILVFADTTQVHRLELSSGARLRVAPPELRLTAFPSLSPDGARVLFFGAESRNDSAGNRRGLYLAGSDGSAPRLLLPLKQENMTASASWSPDMSRLAVSLYPNVAPYEEAAQIVIVDTLGQRIRTVASGSQPSWSPAGDWIAYLSVTRRLQADSSRVRLSSLRVVKPDGTGDQLVFSPSDSATFGAFSERTVAGSPSGRIVLSRDGRSLAFSRNYGGRLTLWTIDLDGSRLHELTRTTEDH